MRFAALQGSGVNDYINAGKAAADATVKSFAINRESAPDYGELARTGMAARSAEKQMAMKTGAQVTKAGIQAVANVSQVAIKESGDAAVRKIGAKLRKAGAIAGLGRIAGAGYLASRDNTKGRKRPSGLSAKKEIWNDYQNNLKGLEQQRDSAYTTYKPGAPLESGNAGSNSSTGSNGETGGNAGKASTGATSLLTGNQKIVADAIAKYESGDWGYEAFNQGGAANGTKVVGKSGSHKDHFGTSLTDLTLSEIFNRQNTKQRGMSMQQHLDSGGLHAVGRYQFIGSTLQDEVKRMGLDPKTTKFTPKIQDDIFLSHIKRVGNISPWVGPANNYSASEKANFRNMISGF